MITQYYSGGSWEIYTIEIGLSRIGVDGHWGFEYSANRTYYLRKVTLEVLDSILLPASLYLMGENTPLRHETPDENHGHRSNIRLLEGGGGAVMLR